MEPPPSRRTRKGESQASSNGSEGYVGRGGDGGMQVTLSQYSQLNSPSEPNFILQFVMPEGHTQGGCSPRLSSAYKLCSEDYSLCCQWVDETQVPDIIPMAGMIFVVDPFEGPAFEYLEEELKRRKEKDYMVIGPQCLRYSLERPDSDPSQSTILNRGYPMYNLGMRNLVVSLSGFRNQGAKSELGNLIRKMGGYPTPQLTMATSHLVTDNPLSEKCAYAYKRNLPVMTDKWVKETWAQSLDGLVHATDPEFTKYECPIFFNLGFCVSQVSGKIKSHLKAIITKNGGSYSPELLKDKTNILVIAKGEGEKFKYSMQWGIKCVTPDWVTESMEANHVLKMDEYVVHPVLPPLSSTAMESRLQASFPDASFSVIANGTSSRMPGIGSNFPTPTKNLNYSITSEATMDDFETIKNASAVGPFLDGCKVFLCDPGKSEQVRKLLNGSGATRMNQLTEDVSHVVVMGGRISEEEKMAIQQLDPKPHVVGFEWLTESAKQGAPANEEPFQTVVEENSTSSIDDRNKALTHRDRTPPPLAVVEEIAAAASETPRPLPVLSTSTSTKVTGLTAFIRRESTANLVGTPPHNFSPGPTNTSTPARAAQQPQSQSYSESIQEHPPGSDLNRSNDIPSESDSPLFGGLSRASSRQIMEAARLMAMGSPNRTFNEMTIKLPAIPETTPEHVMFKRIWDQFVPPKPESPEELNASSAMDSGILDEIRARRPQSKPESPDTRNSLRKDKEKDAGAQINGVQVVPYRNHRETDDISSDDENIEAVKSTKPVDSLPSKSCSTKKMDGFSDEDIKIVQPNTRVDSLPSKNRSTKKMDDSSDEDIEVAQATKRAGRPESKPNTNTSGEMNDSSDDDSEAAPVIRRPPPPIKPGSSLKKRDSHEDGNRVGVAQTSCLGTRAQSKSSSLKKKAHDSSEDDNEIAEVIKPVGSLQSKSGSLKKKSDLLEEDNREGVGHAINHGTRAQSKSSSLKKKKANDSSDDDNEQAEVVIKPFAHPQSKSSTLKKKNDPRDSDIELSSVTKRANRLQSRSTAEKSENGAGMNTRRELRSNRFDSVRSNEPSIAVSYSSISSRVDKTGGGLPSPSPSTSMSRQGDFENSTSKAKRRKTSSSNAGAGWGDNRQQKLTFMFTGVADDDRKRYATMIHNMGGIVNNSSRFTLSVDAIIAGSLARSEKVLSSIASGKRILHTNYIISSNNSGSFLPDPNIYLWGVGEGKTPAEEYLASACGYWFARISGNPNDKPFSKFRAVVFETSKTKADAYNSLITAGGGIVLGKESIESNDANIIICESKEALKKILDTDDLPPIAVKPPFCLHEIIIKCEPCDDSFFDVD